jgi:putative heme iron utilization protein
VSIEAIFQAVEAVAVLIAVGFAIVQVRQYRREKRREAAIELLHSFQTPQFAKALNIVFNLPDGLSKEEIESTVGDDFHLVYALMTTWESLGILVCRGEVDLELVDDFFSGPIKISWQKLEGHVMGERSMLGRDTIEEWFQWLTERLAERESQLPPVPAYIAHKHWPKRRT